MRMLPLLLLSASVFCAGCRIVDGSGGYTPPAEAADHAGALKLGDGILDAIRTRNYRELCKNLPGDFADQVTEPDFLASSRKLEDKFGKLRDFRFLTSLETPAFDHLIWTVDFAKDGANGKPVRRQLLFRVVAMRLDGGVKVASFGFL